MKKVAIAMMIAAGIIGISGTAHAYPPNPPVIEVDNTTPPVGGVFTASVACVGSEAVVFIFNGETKAATCQSDGDGGVATASFSAPPQVGDYVVTAQFPATGETITAVITVTTPPTDTTIPKVGGGSAAGDIIRSGIGIVLVGAAMTAVAGRRRQLVGTSS